MASRNNDLYTDVYVYIIERIYHTMRKLGNNIVKSKTWQ